MIEKIIRYIEKNKIVNEKEIREKFNLTLEDWELISIQLRDLGFFREKSPPSPCNLCSFSKSCSQGYLISDPLSLELQKKD